MPVPTVSQTAAPATSGDISGSQPAALGSTEGKPSVGTEIPSSPQSQPAGTPSTPEAQGTPPGTPAPETTPAIPAKSDELIKKFQSDRDRAEAYAKSLVQKVLPFVEIDNKGNVLGPRRPDPAVEAQQSQQRVMFDGLLKRAMSGDASAMIELQYLTKESTKAETIQEIQKTLAYQKLISETEDTIKREFPGTVNEQGQFDPESPHIKKAQEIAGEYGNQLDPDNPYHLKILMEAAEGRLMRQHFPEVEKKLREEFGKERMKAGAATTGIPSATGGQSDPLSDMPKEQYDQLVREGHNKEDLYRIAKIVNSAKVAGGGYRI